MAAPPEAATATIAQPGRAGLAPQNQQLVWSGCQPPGVSVTAMNHTNAEVTTLPLCGLETGISKAPRWPSKGT